MNQLVQMTVDGYKSIQHMDMRFTNINILNGRKYTSECNFYVTRQRFEFHGRLKVTNADRFYFARRDYTII